MELIYFGDRGPPGYPSWWHSN